MPVVIAATTTLIACSTKTRPVPAVDVLPTATVTATAIGTGLGHPIVVLHYHLPDKPTFKAVDDVEYDFALPKARVMLVIGAPAGHSDPALTNWIASTITLQ